MNDADIISFYRNEFYKEWHMALRNGIKLTADDIRKRLSSK